MAGGDLCRLHVLIDPGRERAAGLYPETGSQGDSLAGPQRQVAGGIYGHRGAGGDGRACLEVGRAVHRLALEHKMILVRTFGLRHRRKGRIDSAVGGYRPDTHIRSPSDTLDINSTATHDCGITCIRRDRKVFYSLVR